MDSRIPPVKRPPLKWYCFLVYFLLFASAILNFVSAVIFFVAVARVELHLIQILNLIMGFVAIGLGCYALKTRSSLYWNKKVGPARICLLYLLSAIFDLAYYVIFYWIITDYYWMFILRDDETPVMIFVSCGIKLLLSLLNYIYFKKRKNLFTY